MPKHRPMRVNSASCGRCVHTPWRNGCTSATVRRVASVLAVAPDGTQRTNEMYRAPVVPWLHMAVIGIRLSPEVNDKPDAHSAPLLHAVVLER